MGDQNKILDVTYGKFSCRLEGFDDAVETMKAVVTYFHDLAGDENFLEVAPGMPDVDTLAEMAKEQEDDLIEVSRNADGLTLSRIVEPQQPPQLEPEVAEVAAPAIASSAIADFLKNENETPQDEVALALSDDETPVFEEPSEIDADAETQEEIAEEADPLAEAAPDPAIDVAVAEDVTALDTAPDEVTDEVIVEAADQTLGTDADVTPEFEEETASVTADDMAETAEATEEEASDDESMSARLDRIRTAVINEPVAPPEPEPAVEVTPAPVSKAGNPLAQRLAQLAKRNSELMEADARLEAPRIAGEDEEESDTASAAPEASDDQENAGEITSEMATLDAGDEVQDETLQPGDLEVAHSAETTAAAEEAEADAPQTALQDTAEETAEDSDSDLETAEVAEAAAKPEEAETKAPETAPSGEATRPLLLTTPQRPATVATVATTDDEDSDDEDDDFDLTAELAEVEKEIAANPRNEMTRHGLPRRVEDAMSRIFSETNHQLDAPEGRRNRDALAQLKAAVAATEAAKQLGDSARSRDAGAAFRDDLGALDAENRDKPDGLPPLKLVTTTDEEEAKEKVLSDDRVTSKPLDATADRLRQIAAAKEPSATGMDFAGFLERHGVSDLSDKLEAAAAYLAFVEGEPDFTRPQLMRLVQSASSEEITREDGLRCFGRLLRQSRFSKLNNGRFKVDDNTPFRPRTSRMAQG